MLNKVMLIGNLGGDPEMRYTPNGQANTSFSVATSRSYKQNDEWKEDTEWHSIIVWGDRAERAAEQLRKGVKVYVEGRLQTRKWQDKKHDDVTHYKTEVVADVVRSLEKREKTEGEFSAPARGETQQSSRSRVDETFDDLPF